MTLRKTNRILYIIVRKIGLHNSVLFINLLFLLMRVRVGTDISKGSWLPNQASVIDRPAVTARAVFRAPFHLWHGQRFVFPPLPNLCL